MNKVQRDIIAIFSLVVFFIVLLAIWLTDRSVVERLLATAADVLVLGAIWVAMAKGYEDS